MPSVWLSPGGPAARPRVVTRGLRCPPPYPKVVSYGVLGCWRGPLRFLEVPVSLVGPVGATAAFVDGRGSRLGAGRTPLGAADAPAASGSRSWCRRRGGRAPPWRLVRGRWRGRRRAAARIAPAEPRSAGPRPRRARSPPNQRIEHKFEIGSGALRSPTGPGWAALGRQLSGFWETAEVSTTCQQVVSSDPTRGLASHHSALFSNLAEQG